MNAAQERQWNVQMWVIRVMVVLCGVAEVVLALMRTGIWWKWFG